MLVVMATALQAAEISQQQAMEKARAFMQNHQTAGGAMHRAPLHIDMQGTQTDHQLLYAFNVEGGGFVIYNLAGQRIGKLQKGINIIGNQKVLVK